MRTTDADCIVSCNFVLGHPVGEDAAGDREQQQRSELREHHQADERRRDPVRTSMYAGSVKFCIHVPMFDSARPMKMMRNPR